MGLNSWESELQALRASGLGRKLVPMEGSAGVTITRNGKRLLNFSSNDYLGSANHPRLREAATVALKKYGTGSGAARLICGNLKVHEELESATARFKGTEAALSFSSGYATALGVIPAVVGKGDTVILDKLSHACLIDGARLSGATVRVFPHGDLNYLEKLLQKSEGKRLIVTESIFSMDGDAAPLKELVTLKERYGAWLMVDEAHATGIFGKRHAGCAEAAGLSNRIELQMGTYSKALGSAGGYVAGSRTLIDYLVHRARSFIYSTGPSPVVAAASLAAIQWLGTEEGRARVKKLWENVRSFEKLSGFRSASPIFPIPMGGEVRALEAAKELEESGILAVAIRYPTVPRGKARLRVTLTAAHEKAQIKLLSNALRRS